MKFRLTEETIKHANITLYRIEALKDFSDIKKGDKGGFVETEANLRHSDNAWVYGDAWVYGNALIGGDALIENIRDILWLSIVGSENGTLTAFKTKDKQIWITRGCFSGSLEKFEAEVRKTHRNNNYAQEYLLIIELIKNRFKEVE